VADFEPCDALCLEQKRRAALAFMGIHLGIGSFDDSTLLVFYYIDISPKSMNSIKGTTEKGALLQYWVGTKKVTRLMK